MMHFYLSALTAKEAGGGGGGGGSAASSGGVMVVDVLKGPSINDVTLERGGGGLPKRDKQY